MTTVRPRKVPGPLLPPLGRTGVKGKRMDEFKPGPHPVGLNNLTAIVEEVTRVEMQDDETMRVQVRTATVPEGFSVPVTLLFDLDQFARAFNLSLRK